MARQLYLRLKLAALEWWYVYCNWQLDRFADKVVRQQQRIDMVKAEIE